MTIIAAAPSLAKEIEVSVGANRACSNRRSGENECHNGKYAIATSSVCIETWSIYHEGELREKLL